MSTDGYPYSEYQLTIELGNAAMQSREDIADALRRVAQMMEDGAGEGSIMDNNGNHVGTWKVA